MCTQQKRNIKPRKHNVSKKKVSPENLNFPHLSICFIIESFSSANHFSSSLCPVQCRGWTGHDSRAAFCFLIIHSVALGQLEQTSQLRQPKPAWKRKWLISSKVFLCLLPLLRLHVLQKCSFTFAILLEYHYPSFMGRKLQEWSDLEWSVMFSNEVQLLMKFSNSANQPLGSQNRHLEEEVQESTLHHGAFRCPPEISHPSQSYSVLIWFSKPWSRSWFWLSHCTTKFLLQELSYA